MTNKCLLGAGGWTLKNTVAGNYRCKITTNEKGKKERYYQSYSKLFIKAFAKYCRQRCIFLTPKHEEK